jgi:hypothetical protein
LILSIIYVFILQSYAWETNALLQIKDSKTMKEFSRIKEEQRLCNHERSFLLFPITCETYFTTLEQSKWADSKEVQILRIELENTCNEKVLQTQDLQKLLAWEKHASLKSRCSNKIKERIGDLIYSKG